MDNLIVKRRSVPTSANKLACVFYVIAIFGALFSLSALGSVYPSIRKISNSTPFFGIIYLFLVVFLHTFIRERYIHTDEAICKYIVNIIFGLNSIIACWGLSGMIIFETIKAFFFEGNVSVSFVPGAFKIYLGYIIISLIGTFITIIILKKNLLLDFKIEERYYTQEDIIRDQVKKEMDRKRWEEEEWEIIEKERAKREGRRYYY